MRDGLVEAYAQPRTFSFCAKYMACGGMGEGVRRARGLCVMAHDPPYEGESLRLGFAYWLRLRLRALP
jgi:hypothetical protein